MNREETVKLLAIITSAYPQVKISDADIMTSTWLMELGDYSAESVYKAARLHIATSSYFPNPANIINNIVKADLIYSGPPLNAIEANSTNSEAIDKYLDAFCEWIGFGCEPNDNVILPNFLPYEQ